jgi:hypothetical protein
MLVLAMHNDIYRHAPLNPTARRPRSCDHPHRFRTQADFIPLHLVEQCVTSGGWLVFVTKPKFQDQIQSCES